jgi:hypothetical protein
MKKRRPRSDDVLFISALAAILLGVACLLYTTKTMVGVPHAWPILVIAVGGALLYFALVRGASFSIFFGGLFFVLEGAFFLAAVLLDWKLAKSWPLAMAIAGLAGLVSGLAAKRGLKAFFAVPSIGFTLLGLIFSLFSFGLAKVTFKSFIVVWWPTLLILGGISLFVACGISRHAFRATEGRAKTRAGRSADRSGRDRGPQSGP